MKKYLTFYLLTYIFFSPIVHAEEDENIVVLSPLTVTSTRTSQSSKLVSTTLITREDIERLQINTIEEALRGIAGINITNAGGLGKLTAISLRGTESDHVLVLIDGIRVGSASVGQTAFEHLPISEIESIEVVRGPRSSLYGSEAIGGIIHIHTRRGAATTVKPTFSVGTGSHDRQRYSVGVSGSTADSWYNLNLSHEESSGYNSCSSFSACFTVEPDDDGYRNESGSVRLGHRFTDWLLAEGHILYSDGDTEFDADFTTGNQSDFIQQVIGGQVKIQPTDFWGVTLKAGESRDRLKTNYNGAFLSHFNTERLSLSVQNDIRIGEDHLLTLGYDYLNDRVDAMYVDTIFFNGFNGFDETSRHNHAFFAQYQGNFYNHELVLGIREDNDEQFGQHTTWNAAWGYQFSNGFNVSAAYATAYKVPNFIDLYTPFDPANFFFGNPDLQPERSRSYELGIGGQHQWGQWSVNSYVTYIRNLIQYVFATRGPQNVDKARILGLEMIVGTQLYGFDINASLTLLEPEDRSSANKGDVLPNRAEQIFRFDVDRTIGSFGLGATVIAEGHRFDAFGNRAAGFVTLDLRAEYEIIDNLIVQAKVNNVLDKHYQTVAGFDQDNLNLFFTLRYSPEL